jgi:hypothetical protein
MDLILFWIIYLILNHLMRPLSKVEIGHGMLESPSPSHHNRSLFVETFGRILSFSFFFFNSHIVQSFSFCWNFQKSFFAFMFFFLQFLYCAIVLFLLKISEESFPFHFFFFNSHIVQSFSFCWNFRKSSFLFMFFFQSLWVFSTFWLYIGEVKKRSVVLPNNHFVIAFLWKNKIKLLHNDLWKSSLFISVCW